MDAILAFVQEWWAADDESNAAVAVAPTLVLIAIVLPVLYFPCIPIRLPDLTKLLPHGHFLQELPMLIKFTIQSQLV
jgi:hypothetical protein